MPVLHLSLGCPQSTPLCSKSLLNSYRVRLPSLLGCMGPLYVEAALRALPARYLFPFNMPAKQNESPVSTGSRLGDPSLLIVSIHEREMILARRVASGHPPEAFDAPAGVIEQLFPTLLQQYRTSVMEEVAEKTLATATLLFLDRMVGGREDVA